jgi:hypothetical protein
MKEFINELNENYTVPCFQTIKEKINIFSETTDTQLIKITSNLENASISTDGWKSNLILTLGLNKLSFYTCFIYYYDINSDNFISIRSLKFSEIDSKHITGEILQIYFDKMFKKYGINNKIISSTTGNKYK